MIWVIWHARNKIIFEDLCPRASNAITFVLAAIREANPLVRGGMDGSVSELSIARSLGVPSHPHRRRVPIFVRWRPPQAGWYKANIDGSVSSAPGYMYAGVIFRNSRGFFAGALYTRTGRGFPLEAKLVAILHSIIYAHAQGWRFLWVESDSSLIVDTVQKMNPLIPWRLRGMWCRAMLTTFDMMIMYSHIFREANQAADCLAKLHTNVVWQGLCPDFLLHFLYGDMHSEYFHFS
ncbi:hypothetical protein ACS0TY_035050 [Phlomoides rotata]